MEPVEISENDLFDILSGKITPDGNYYCELNPEWPSFFCVAVENGKIHRNKWRHKEFAFQWLSYFNNVK